METTELRRAAKSSDIATRYSERYERQSTTHLYPVDFVVRALLGTYPGLKMNRACYSGSRILDLGYADGRNMFLLHNLGFKIFGVEIHEDIGRSTLERLRALGVEATLSVGTNSSIPFPNEFFHYALACHVFTMSKREDASPITCRKFTELSLPAEHS
jgi:hypothetical protein